MANPYFNATYYLSNNPDVFAAGINTEEGAWTHYVNHGAAEALSGAASRSPAPWFDISYYLSSNPDLTTAGLNANQLFEHFVNYGISEGRQPSAGANVNEASLTAYAAANEDLREAFGIEEGEEITEEQYEQLAQHLYSYGYAENRPGNPLDNGGGSEPGDFTLTTGWDNISGTEGDDVFSAPVVQNQTGSGELANTFETGDILNGGGGRDILRADLIGTGTVQDNWFGSAPISATTSNIEEVYLRAQRPNAEVTVDAEKMSGVEQWWTDNSRADIAIEDIRSATADTTFGMRETDPGVSFYNFFNVNYLQGDQSSDSALTIDLQEITNGQDPAATELQNITVHEVNFALDGQDYTLASEDMRAADTWADLEAAVAAQLEEQGLEGVTVAHQGGGRFVIDDAQGREFAIEQGQALIIGTAPDIDVRNRITDEFVPIEGPTQTDVILDGVGNGSQGGELIIGAMSGLRGIEVFNVSVDQDSHLVHMGSGNATASPVLVENRFLEVVNLESIGANGNLQVGERTETLDRRADTDGLINVREVNGADFAGELNLGISLDDNTIGRYLDDADEAVNFVYTGGAQNDLFNIEVDNDVADDPDFAMQVDMGAGDDRLVIDVATARAVSVDGGEGENSIVVSQSHGTNAANTFAEFANFQTYEIEGTNNTAHDFDSMSGVENVVIATGNSVFAGGDTALINLEAEQDVTISGKNQTIGNASNDDQEFGVISLIDDAGVSRTVTLDNTARVDGDLEVDGLVIGKSATGTSATRTLEIVSAGTRNTSNAIFDVDAALVNTFNLTGTQDLLVDITAAANSAATVAAQRDALVVNGTDLGGDLGLAIAGDIITNVNAASKGVTLTGTAGEEDVLFIYDAALDVTNNTIVNGFEDVVFDEVSGDVDLANFNGVESYFILETNGDFALNNMSGDESVWVDADETLGDTLTFVAASQSNTNVLDIEYETDDILGGAIAVDLAVQDFRTIQLDLGGEAEINNDYTINLQLLDDQGRAVGDAGYTIADVYARSLVITGGGVDSAGVLDTVTLVGEGTGGEVTNVLTHIDFSDYVGQINALTLKTDEIAGPGRNMTIELNGYGATIDEDVTIPNNNVTYVIAEAVGGAWNGTAYQNVVAITGFDERVGNVLEDISILDLRAVGVTQITDLVFDITTDAGNLILTDVDNTFAVQLVGIADGTNLHNDNFIFA